MADRKESLTIRFEGLTVAEAGVHAAEMQKELLALQHEETGKTIESIDLRKDSQATQDFGATLAIILGTPAVVLVARGIANYLSRTGTRVTIKKDGAVVVENVKGDDAAKIVESINGKK